MKKNKILLIMFSSLLVTPLFIILASCSGSVNSNNLGDPDINKNNIINVNKIDNVSLNETRQADLNIEKLKTKDMNTLKKYFNGINSETIKYFSIEAKIKFPNLSNSGILEIKLNAINNYKFSNNNKTLINNILITKRTSINIRVNNSFPTINNIANAKIRELESNNYSTLKEYFTGEFTQNDLKYLKTTVSIQSKGFNSSSTNGSYVVGSMVISIDANEGYAINNSNSAIQGTYDIQKIRIGTLNNNHISLDTTTNNYYLDVNKIRNSFTNINEYGFIKYDIPNDKSFAIKKDFFEFFPNWKTINKHTFNLGISTKDNMFDQIEIGNNITTIGDDTFRFINEISATNTNNRKASKITNLKIGENVREIGKYAFWNLLIKDNITIPNSVKIIGVQAFYIKFYSGNDGDPTLTPANPQVNWNFLRSAILREIKIGSGISIIPIGTFFGRITSNITLSDSITSIENYAFNTNINLFEEDKNFNRSSFWNNNIVSNLNLPIYLENIGIHAFGFNNITSITIPNSIKTIGQNAFEYNKIKNPPVINSSIGQQSSIFSNQR